MNRVVVLAFIGLLGLVVFVSSLQMSKEIPGYGTMSGNYVEVKTRLYQGWNLVYGLPSPDWINGGDIEAKNIKAIYGFDPKAQDYIRMYPNPEKEKLNSPNTRLDTMLHENAFWVYSDCSKEDGCQVDYSAFEPMSSIVGYVLLLKGLNLVAITPEMIGKSLNQLKGDCIIEKVYYWSSPANKWFEFSKSELIVKDYNWNGLVVRTSNSCNLAVSGDIIVPPSLPESNGIVPPVNSNPSYDFPANIGTYSLNRSTHEDKKCTNEGTLCIEMGGSEYRDSSSNKVVFIDFTDITKGTKTQLKETYAKAVGGTLETITINGNKMYKLENHELFWFTGKDSPAVVFSQEGNITYTTDGTRYNYGKASGDNVVTKKFLSLYPPEEVD